MLRIPHGLVAVASLAAVAVSSHAWLLRLRFCSGSMSDASKVGVELGDLLRVRLSRFRGAVRKVTGCSGVVGGELGDLLARSL